MKVRLFACVFAAWFLLVAGSEKPKAFLHCYVQLFPHEGMKKEDVIPVELASPRSMIFVSKVPDLSEADMSHLEMLPEGKTMIVFNEQGKRKLAALTQANMESIFVVVCNGRVVYAPLIDTVISNGRLLIPGGISPEEVNQFNELIKTGEVSTPTAARTYQPYKKKTIQHSTRGAAIRENSPSEGE